MRVGTGAENSGDHELGLWKLVSKHRHEGNGSSLGNRAGRLLKKGFRSLMHGIIQPVCGFWGIPASRSFIELEADFCALGLILCEHPFDGFSCFGGVHHRRNPDREFQ